MVLVFLNWCYMAITMFLIGFAFLSVISKKLHYTIQYQISYYLAGFVMIMGYSQYISLFIKVSFLANLIIVIICLFIAITMRNELIVYKNQVLNHMRRNPHRTIVYAILLLVFVYGTSRGLIHYDTGLYHAQSIRWIEEYGVVKGLANLHNRFAYNSAVFTLTAFYSMEFLIGQSLHTTAGFLAYMAMTLVVDLPKCIRTRQITIRNFVQIGLLYYLVLIYSEMISPASDYYAQLLIFIVILLGLSIREHSMIDSVECVEIAYGGIALLIASAITIKLSVVPLLLFSMIPIVMLIRNRQYKIILGYVIAGITILLPYFIRNIIISGWLAYPSMIVDIFSVDWQLPIDSVVYDAKEIRVYARGNNDIRRYYEPFNQWIPEWFRGLPTMEKTLVVCNAFSVVIATVLGVWHIFTKKISSHTKEYYVLMSTLLVNLLFWFLAAPLVRYGYAYLIVYPLIVCGYCYMILYKKYPLRVLYYGVATAMIAFVLWCGKGIVYRIYTTIQEPYYMRQKDYPDGDATTYDVNGVIIYVPTYYGQIGYKKFPSSPTVKEIELRGDTIADGFRSIE